MFTTAKETRDNTGTATIGAAKDNMVNEGGNAVHDVKDAARRLKSDTRDAANTVKGDIEDVARKTGRHMRDLADNATHNIGDIAGSMTVKIRDNPIQSSLIALGVGVFFGMLYRR